MKTSDTQQTRTAAILERAIDGAVNPTHRQTIADALHGQLGRAGEPPHTIDDMRALIAAARA